MGRKPRVEYKGAIYHRNLYIVYIYMTIYGNLLILRCFHIIIYLIGNKYEAIEHLHNMLNFISIK